MEKMLAGLICGIRDFQLREVPKPSLQKDTDALLKVTAVAPCTSDLHHAEGYEPISAPFIFGHEFVGTIVETGKAIKNFKVGDHVDVACFPYCNNCEMCKRGLTGHCLNSAVFGSDKLWGDLSGAMAEYVRVPLADTSCVLIPDGVSDEQAVLVGDMLATGYQGVFNANIKPGQIVAVFGLGSVGLCAITLAKQKNPSRIIGIGRRPNRLEAALKCGADAVIDIDKEDVVARVREITGGDPIYPEGSPFTGYVDSCIDCCGYKEATDNQIRILKTGGVISQVGMADPKDFTL